MKESNKYFLTGLEGPALGREFLLIGSEIKIGRTAENDIVLAEKSVSRHHASICPRGSALWIEDRRSKNGVFVNERPVKSSPLHENDILRLGNSVFRVGVERHVVASSERLQEMVARASRIFGLVSKIGPKRLALYSLPLAALYLVLSTVSPPTRSTAPKSPESSGQAPGLHLDAAVGSGNATEEEIVAWQARADQALRFNDLAAAIPPLQKVVAAHPGNPEPRSQLKRAEERLASLVKRYYESGAQEYEKHYYDRAISDWQKVLSLTAGLDREMYRRTEQRIVEVQARLMK